MRAVVACFWYGAQTAAASGAMVALLIRSDSLMAFRKGTHFLGHAGLEVICYAAMAFSAFVEAMNMPRAPGEIEASSRPFGMRHVSFPDPQERQRAQDPTTKIASSRGANMPTAQNIRLNQRAQRGRTAQCPSTTLRFSVARKPP